MINNFGCSKKAVSRVENTFQQDVIDKDYSTSTHRKKEVVVSVIAKQYL